MNSQSKSLNENSLVRVGELVRVYHNNTIYSVGDIGILTAGYDYKNPKEDAIFCSFLEYRDGVKTSGQVILFKMLK